MQFKIMFPAPYQVRDIYNDNLDLNIVLENGEVFFGTLFTLQNIKHLMESDSDIYFWSTDMLILKDLSYESISIVVKKLLNDGILKQVFSKIGTIESVFSHLGWNDFSDIPSC
ncbi:hypothetical protein GCM10022216_23990 [Sphingobacterium kyonggiense]|uniref:STAS domain-containing protein n=1 Tax=Sphingobacterium kyonggiense TaxID=714075 RepID=A0ABP7YX19_9SPHI